MLFSCDHNTLHRTGHRDIQGDNSILRFRLNLCDACLASLGVLVADLIKSPSMRNRELPLPEGI